MKFAFSTLQQYLQTNASANEICEKLTSIGLEVENFEDKARDLKDFTVAKIIDAKPHENSNKLKICQVQTIDSDAPLQIICGAANARSGLKVAYAKIGSVIPANQMVIKKAKIAGAESNGMLCSTSELGLKGDDAGIIEIDEKFQIGDKISDIFGVNEQIIEINVTPNRGDCLGVYGIARDLAASGAGVLKKLEIAEKKAEFDFPLAIENNAKEACNYAVFRAIKNVKNCSSPAWLKEKLESVGINSISAIVDATNYVMHVLNRPMHAYDASKIQGKIDIRFAKKDEKFTSLKDAEYVLDEKILTICDAKNILGIAGVIGSKDSGCSMETVNIILESAFFTPQNISYAGRKLNILSDARYRFERGVDEASCLDGINLATNLILEICGGNPSEIKIIGQKSELRKINFDVAKIKKLIGVEIPQEKVKEIFSNLGFIVDENFTITIPSHRSDIKESHDLIEEAIRLFGYDKILPEKLENINSLSKNKISTINKARLTLANQGLVETINWSFVDENLLKLFDETNENLLIKNPISSEMNHMRSALNLGLIQSYKKNYLRGNVNLAIFEIGNVFAFEGEKIMQKQMIAGLRAGKNQEQSHYGEQRDFDIFDVKQDFTKLTESFGLNFDNLQIDVANPLKYYHPHRFARLKLGKNIIGYFGEIHPKISKEFDVKTRLNLFEVFVDALPNSQKNKNKPYAPNDFQIVERDFAFLSDENLAVGDLISAVLKVDKNLIKEVSIFDIFSGKNIEDNKKSIAIRVKIQGEKTLTSQEIDELSAKIIEAAKLKNAVIRS
jgi:phenylalanyl-tRNA synthetase beta chain